MAVVNPFIDYQFTFKICNLFIFSRGGGRDVLAREGVPRTQSTEWYELNKRDSNAQKYLYHQIPEYYTWNKQKRIWKNRASTTKPVIGRLYNVDARAGERFYLRLLILHKRGCTSFEEVRTVENVIYDTYREVARAIDLLSDDSIWHDTLTEAEGYQMPYQLRELFVIICIFCEPSNV